ncbi:MAG TPA: efflux transporter outer membrane subunit, partial [Micavibrio sp.]|nr:efflux transporter outer membrane subunit [Micavibrio sp.]
MKKQRLVYPVLVAALLAGCSMIPEYERPATDTQAGWSEADASNPTVIARDWWKNFNSPELNALMEEALAKNNDLAASIARIDQARALARVAGAPLLPSVEADGSAGWQRTDPATGKTTSDSTGTAGLTVGYELDVFGGNRAELASASADIDTAAYASDALALVVMGDVAKGYFNVLNFEERLKIADQNLQSARELLRIVQARFDAGATTLLDVSQQKSDLASSEASRALVEQQMKAAKSSLAVLVGKAPQNLVVTAKDLRTLSVPAIAPGQPSSLLERRPDIRAAESDLLAANADIGAARAAFFPQFNIGLDLGIAATPLGDP